MSPVEFEFAQLKNRYKNALAYEKTKIQQEPLENKEAAFKVSSMITKRMSELWDLMTDSEKQNHMDLFE